MIVYCQATYLERKDQTLEGLRRIWPYVDRCVIVAPENPEEWPELVGGGPHPKPPKVEYHQEEWTDDFPAYRNKYLSHVKEGDWVIVADPDEWFSESFCQNLRTLLEKVEKEKIGLILINSHDFTDQPDGSVSETKSTFYKNLIFRYTKTVHYQGVGEAKNVHETLILPPGTRSGQLDDVYFYEHHKKWWEVWERAARNVWIGGGGNNVGEKNPSWKPLRQISEDVYDRTEEIHTSLKTWPQARAYFRKGRIDTKLKEWLWENRFEGFDWQHEMMEMGRWYFEYLHPEEAKFSDGRIWKPVTEVAPGSPPEVASFVEQTYLKVMGRHADDAGKKHYTSMILKGEISRDALPGILKQSPEYREKHPEETERVKMNVPVDVDLRLTAQIIWEAITRSETYARKIRPILELGRKWSALLQIPLKAETGGKGLDSTPKEQFEHYVQIFAEHCPPENYPRVLDIGAGWGAETAALREKGYSPIGITFGQENIRQAKEKFSVDLLEMDMHVLQFPDGFFDAAFSIQTFEHTFAPWLHILELRRVLRDGGRVFLDLPDPDDQAMLETIWHTSVLYPNQVKALFAKAGFKQVGDLSQKHRLQFFFEKIPDDGWEMWGYVRFIMERL